METKNDSFYDLIYQRAFLAPKLEDINVKLREEAENIKTNGFGLKAELDKLHNNITTPYDIISENTTYKLTKFKLFNDPNEECIIVTADISRMTLDHVAVNFKENIPYKFEGLLLNESEFEKLDGVLEFAKVFMANPEIDLVHYLHSPMTMVGVTCNLKTCGVVIKVVNNEEKPVILKINYDGKEASLVELYSNLTKSSE